MRELAIHIVPLNFVLTFGLVLIGLLLVCGARRMAAAVFTGGLTAIATSELIGVLLPMIPPVLLVLAAPVVALMMMNSILVVLFGREAAGQIIGTWFVSLCDCAIRLLLLPLRLLWRR